MIPVYPDGELWDELVEVGTAVHWTLTELLDLAHADRLLVLESLADRRGHEGRASHG